MGPLSRWFMYLLSLKCIGLEIRSKVASKMKTRVILCKMSWKTKKKQPSIYMYMYILYFVFTQLHTSTTLHTV